MNYRFTREQLDKLLQQTIEMYIEYKDVHGYSSDLSHDYAVMEMLTGLDADRELVANDPTEYLHLQLPK